MSTPQEIALERYALPGIRWDDMVWVLQDDDSTVSQRLHKSQSKSLWFTKLMPKRKLSNANSVPLTAPFDDAVKAWIKHRASDSNQTVVTISEQFPRLDTSKRSCLKPLEQQGRQISPWICFDNVNFLQRSEG